MPGTEGDSALLELLSIARATKESVDGKNETRLLRTESTADTALHLIQQHDKICELRYKNLDDGMTANKKTLEEAIPLIFSKLDALKEDGNRLNNKMTLLQGIWLGVTGIGTILGIIYAVYKFSH
jgi:hypothetical protein